MPRASLAEKKHDFENDNESAEVLAISSDGEPQNIETSSTWRTQIFLLMRKRWLMAWRTKKATLSEIFIPVIFLLIFNAPDISILPSTSSISTSSTSAESPQIFSPNASTALGLMSTFVSSPVFPPLGPFDATYIPATWSEPPGLAFAPNSSARARRVMNVVKSNIFSNSISPVPLLGFENEDMLVRYYEANPMTIWAGIVFNETTSQAGDTLTQDWHYSIRINGSFAPNTQPESQFARRGHLGGAKKYDWYRYYQTGFAILQYSLDQAIIADVDPTYSFRASAEVKGMESLECFIAAASEKKYPKCNISANVGFRELPQNVDMTVDLLWIFKWLPGWCLNVASVFFLSAQVIHIVTERQHRSSLELMGLNVSAMHMHNVLHGILMAIPTAVLFGIMWRLVRVITSLSNMSLVSLFLASYLVSLTSFAMALAPFLTKGKDRISQVAFLLCFLLGLAYVGAMLTSGNSSGRGSGTIKLWLSMFPFGAAHLGGEIIVNLEGAMQGLRWSNVALGGAGGEPSMADLMVCIWCSTLLWGLLACYLDRVVADPESGDSYHPCFCVMNAHTCFRNKLCSSGIRRKSLLESLLDKKQLNYGSPYKIRENHEPIRVSLQNSVSVHVRNLTKIYKEGVCCGGKSKTALKGLDFDLVKGQIFSLLGHNGAGKTTCLMCITQGNMTSGTVSYNLGSPKHDVNGTFNIKNGSDRKVIQNHIGVCPQHDLLWDQCTPREHLRFFARMKGVPDGDFMDKTIDRLLEQIQLPAGDNDRPVGLFSGGNKRKVSLAISMVGNPSVVLLDEPTAGMDPKSRRSVWDLLQTFKRNRTIVLCTHFLDEADMLGDRIGIMCKGEMVCSGSSLFLKHKFGSGYTLSVAPNGNVLTNELKNAKAVDSFGMVTSFVPSAKLLDTVTRNGMTIEESWSLPMSSVKIFPHLFKRLEAAGIRISVGQTTLEDVFLSVGKRFGGETEIPNVSESPKGAVSSAETLSFVDTIRQLRRSPSCPRRTSPKISPAASICSARLKTLLRSPNSILMQICIPLCMLIMAFASAAMFHETPYIKPNPLILGGNAVMDHAKGSAISLGNYTKCAADLVSNNSSFISALMESNSQRDLYYDNFEGISSRAWFGFHPIRKWQSEIFLLKNITEKFQHSKHGQDVQSCGGLVYEASKSDESVDSTGLAWYEDKAVIILSNSSMVTSMPVMLSLYSNTVLSQRMQKNVTKPSIHVQNHPFPYYAPKVVNTAQLFLPMFVGMGFIGLGLGGISLIKDRETKRRHVMHLRGLKTITYIAGNLLFDLSVVGYPLMILGIALVFIFDVSWLKGTHLVGWIALATPSILGTVLLGYMSNYIFANSMMAGRIWPAALPALTIIPFIVCFVLKHSASTNLPSTQHHLEPQSSSSGYDTADIISLFFCIVPPFALQEGTSRLIKLKGTTLQDVFQLSLREGVLLPTLLAAGFSALAFLIIATLETGNEGANSSSSSKSLGSELTHQACESSKDEINVTTSYHGGITTNGLRKVFTVKHYNDSRQILAVRNVDMEVRPGELVILLGSNGAGKSTLMSILGTEILPTSGNVRVSGVDLSLKESRQRLRESAMLGFCPQFDALYEELTVAEHLSLFASIQGIPTQDSTFGTASIGELLARAAGLGEYLHVASRNLSGGNRRKLSLVLALLGSPKVLLLDEISTGVDAISKRILWRLLSHYREHAAILLSTHSMEEAVALGDRICIMVAGRCVADGTRLSLQHEFGSGLVIEVSVREGFAIKVKDFLESRGAKLVERFCDQLKFLMRMSIAESFTLMESITLSQHDNKKSGGKICESDQKMVEYYAISHPTMQDVFMTVVLQARGD